MGLIRYYWREFLFGLFSIFSLGVLLWLTTTGFPTTRHPPREIAGYFQSLAIIRTGLESYTFVTPVESLSALHLHSLLSAPVTLFVGPIGGRLTSLLFAIIAMWVLYRIGSLYADTATGLLSAAFLLSQPLFFHHSYVYKPETLSVAITAAAVLTMTFFVRGNDNTKNYWFIASVILTCLSITVHLWEAVILLPTTVLLLWHQEYRRAGINATLGTISAGLVYFLTTLQSVNAVDLQQWVVNDASRLDLLYPSFWLDASLSPLLTVFGGFTAIAFSALLFYLRREEIWLLTGSWALSGFAVFVLVPGHWTPHRYTAWGFIAPAALFGAVFIAQIMGELVVRVEIPRLDSHDLLTVIALVTVLASAGLIIDQEMPYTRYDNPDRISAYVEAGEESRDLLNGSERLAIYDPSIGQNPYYDPGFANAIIHSGILPKHLHATAETWPRALRELPDEVECDVMIRATDEGSLEVERCSG